MRTPAGAARAAVTTSPTRIASMNSRTAPKTREVRMVGVYLFGQDTKHAPAFFLTPEIATEWRDDGFATSCNRGKAILLNKRTADIRGMSAKMSARLIHRLATMKGDYKAALLQCWA